MPPETDNGARLAALRFAVRDVAATKEVLRAANVDFSEPMRQLVVGPKIAMGATLVFEGAG